jgi:hypothetical protein
MSISFRIAGTRVNSGSVALAETQIAVGEAA